jgi:site-specific DNA-methyltransferase (adenine-specific)
MINPLAAERLGYPTQKPLRLLERIVLAASRPGEVVADLCCGSGTAAAAAQAHGRRWIAADVSPDAIATAGARLAALPGPPEWEFRRLGGL